MTRLEELAAVMSDLVAEMVQAGATQEYVRAVSELAWFTGQPANAGTEQTPTIISSLDAAYHQAQLAIGPTDQDITMSAVVSMAQFADILDDTYRRRPFVQLLHGVSTYRGITLRPVREARCSVLIASLRYAGEADPRILMTVPLLPDPAVPLPKVDIGLPPNPSERMWRTS